MSLKRIVPLLIFSLVAAACSGGGSSSAAPGGSSSAAPGASASGSSGQIIVGLITKTDTNPFFVKMKDGAQAKATELGVKLMTGAGAKDGDNEGQVTALENMVNAGAKGVLITPSDTKAIVPSIQKARDKGVVVIALDTATDPQSAVDALFATNNFNAGLLIGQWAKAYMAGKTPVIATLDLQPGITVGAQRHNGFLHGYGLASGIAPNPPGLTINEPAAFGAYQAIKSAGKDKAITIVSVDGGCQGVQGVVDGKIAATSQQYPLKMASLGVQALYDYATKGTKPSGYTDTGVTLITDKTQTGVDSKDSTYGTANCWGTK